MDKIWNRTNLKNRESQVNSVLTADLQTLININNLATKLHVVHSLVSWRPRKTVHVQKQSDPVKNFAVLLS